MKTRVIVAIAAIPILILILVYFPPYILTGAASLISALISFELIRAISPSKGNLRPIIYTIIAALIIPFGAYFDINSFLVPVVLLILMCLVFIEAIVTYNTEKQYPFILVLASLFGGILIPYLLSSVIYLRVLDNGRYLVLLPIICAFITDAGAYFTGTICGKHKAFPQVSPNKTIEGCIGGIVLGTLSLPIYGLILINFMSFEISNFWVLFVYGFFGAIICELGDLAFSLVKREFKIKDYGKLLPGHGGALDRFDSMIFTAPAIYLLFLVLPLI